MGSEDGHLDEAPRHEVRVTRPYYLAETEVTRGQWAAFVAETGYRTTVEEGGQGITRLGNGNGWQASSLATWQTPWPDLSPELSDDHPVTQVSFLDACRFCEHYGYRLPTEAEWEYAARAGAETEWPWGFTETAASRHGNFAAPVKDAAKGNDTAAGSVRGLTAPVGGHDPNSWGFFDMLGNVWEWCADAYDPTGYEEASLEDPVADRNDANTPRVLRGGSWLTSPAEARCARRAWDWPDRATDGRGFRIAFTP